MIVYVLKQPASHKFADGSNSPDDTRSEFIALALTMLAIVPFLDVSSKLLQ